MTAQRENLTVVTANGQRGVARAAPAQQGERAGLLRVTLDSGRELWVGPELLIRQPDGRYLLPMAIPAEAAEQVETMVVPVIEEEAVVEKRVVPTGGVRVTKVVREREEQVDTTAVQEEVEVQREAVDTFVDTLEPARVEGERTIIPIYEEVVVVEKRMRLKERWVITKRRVEVPGTETLTLKREEALIERLEANPGETSPKT
jgi:uncharacterized protein (TIGR02271 family)